MRSKSFEQQVEQIQPYRNVENGNQKYSVLGPMKFKKDTLFKPGEKIQCPLKRNILDGSPMTCSKNPNPTTSASAVKAVLELTSSF